MGTKQWINDNFYIYGETGEKLSGVRSSDIYKNSAKGINNFEITQLGTLEVAKQFDVATYSTLDTQKLFNTEYDHYILMNLTGDTLTITTIDKDTYAVIDTETATVQYNLIHWNYFEGNLIFLENGFKTKLSWLIDENGNIAASTFWDTVLLPVKNKKTLEFDLYRIYSGVPKLIATYTNTDLSTDGTGQLFLGADNDIQIHRMYLDYKSDVTQFGSPVDGQYYGVMKDYQIDESDPNPTNSYIIGNDRAFFLYPYAIDDPTYAGKYQDEVYAEGTGPAVPLLLNASGNSCYGELLEILTDDNQLVTSCVFQNRLFLMNSTTIYGSRLFDFNDFRNGTNADDPFYLSPTAVNGEKVEIYDSVAGEGLYIGAKDTIYLLGFQIQLTPSSSISSVQIVSRIGVSTFINSMVTINKDLYYRDKNKKLMAIQTSYKTGILEFIDNTVDKYFDETVNAMTPYHRQGEDFLLVSTGNGAKLYKKLDINIWQRRSKDIETGNYYFFTDGKIFEDTKVLTETNNNVSTAVLEMHRPNLNTKKGGIYLNDWASLVKRVVMDLYDEDKEGLQDVFLQYGGDTVWTNFMDQDGIHKIETSFKVSNQYKILLATQENDKKIELRGITTLVDANGE